MQDHTARIAITVVATVATSLLAVVLGIACVLGWPLSHDNFVYALGQGLLWGIIGSGLLGIAISKLSAFRTSAILTGSASLLWSAVIGICFLVYSAVLAAC